MKLFHTKSYFTPLLILVVALPLTLACNPTKLVPANDALYTGAKVKLTNSDAPAKQNKVLETDLNALTRPKPNSKLLGIRFKLGLYNMAGKGTNFFSKFLRKSGEPPVLLSQLSLQRNIELLQNVLENKGFFHAKVSGDTIVDVKKRMARAEYVANAGIQYKINEVTFPADSSVMSESIRSISNKTILKKGESFNLDVVKGERLRIDVTLKERGFFYFSPDDLIVLVDSTIGNNLTNLKKMKNTTNHTKPKIIAETTLADLSIVLSFRS
jgi:outer membrane protein insertion porin family